MTWDEERVTGGAGGTPLTDRLAEADLWDAAADEQERLADERERLADERDALADEREWLADRHDRELDRREADRGRESGSADLSDQLAQAQAAVHRAEAALHRAEARLVRARQVEARIAAQEAQWSSAAERATAVLSAEQAVDLDEQAWLADRRDFVAVERERLARARTELADQRDQVGDLRERLADDRERAALERQRRFDRGSPTAVAAGGDGTPRRVPAGGAGVGPSAPAPGTARAPQAYGPMLVASFAAVAQHLFAVDDLRKVLADVLGFTVDAVEGCQCSGIVLCRDGRVVDTASSGAVAAELDDVQFRRREGPALDALGGGPPVYVPDLTALRDWPALSAAARRVGISTVLCHRLVISGPVEGIPLGVFTLYGAAPAAFSDAAREFATILTAYLSVTVATFQRRDEVDRREAALHRGLTTRDVIGQAKGILMERQHLSAGDAFDMLRRASQGLNRRLADVARHLAETGELPT